jgi:hypothetical protein
VLRGIQNKLPLISKFESGSLITNHHPVDFGHLFVVMCHGSRRCLLSVGCDNYALIEGFRDKAKSSLTSIRINKCEIKIIIAPVLLYGEKKNSKTF